MMFTSAAYADDGPDAPDADDGHTDHDSGHANPAEKQLPSTASDTAKQNAFGQQGDRMRAAHQAARAAAVKAAHDAATQGPPPGVGGPNHHANGHADPSAHDHGASAAAGASHGHGHGH